MKLFNLKFKQLSALVALLIIFLALCIGSLLLPLRESLTIDEDYHYHAGYAVLTGRAADWGEKDSNQRNVMPAIGINTFTGMNLNKVFPRIISVPESVTGSNVVFLSKLATIVVSTVLAVYVFIWSRQLYGLPAAFLALGVYVLEPNIIAHSRLLTQDLWGTASTFIAVYYFWRYINNPELKNLLLSCLTFALAQICRFTGIYLGFIYLLLFIPLVISYLIKVENIKNIKVNIADITKKIFSYIGTLIVITILVINMGFAFERTFVPLKDYKFTSESFSKLQANPLLKRVPVPVPYAYLQGLDMGKTKQETGFGSGTSYRLGELGFKDEKLVGFWDYYIVAFLYKVPLALQILIALGLLSIIVDRKQINIWRNEAFLLVPVLVYFVNFSFMTAQLGIRYILMVFPFLIVIASRSILHWHNHRPRYRILIISLGIYLLISNLSYFPHYISYFNELLTDRTKSYTILADSNLDWGQNQVYLEEYLKQHPDAALAKVDAGKILLKRGKEVINPDDDRIKYLIVEANQLVGITVPPRYFQWWRESKTPVDSVAYSYLVYEHDTRDREELLTILKLTG